MELPCLTSGDVYGQWKIIDEIDIGGFGIVYKVENCRTKEICAMKVEPIAENPKTFNSEVAVLAAFRQSNGHAQVCKYYNSDITERFRYIVMQLVGPSLASLSYKCRKRRFNESTAVRIGMQCIQSIEALHVLGFIHRDVKPSNFAIGQGDEQRTIFMLDFGLARKIVDAGGHLLPPRKRVRFHGTAEYASPNMHMRLEQGRHDDLWSLLYMLIHLQQGRLPWHELSEEEQIGKMKNSVTADQLLEGMPLEFHAILNELHRLTYSDKPNYDWFIDQLQAIAEREKYKKEDPFSWEPSGMALKEVDPISILVGADEEPSVAVPIKTQSLRTTESAE